MIRFRLKELMADKAFKENRRITMDEISAATDVHRTTLSRIANKQGYSYAWVLFSYTHLIAHWCMIAPLIRWPNLLCHYK